METAPESTRNMDGVRMSLDAAQFVHDARRDVQADLAALRAGKTPEAFLAECLDQTNEDDAEQRTEARAFARRT